jgi:RNA polymerase sigma-70 factor (ECF subfamily)
VTVRKSASDDADLIRACQSGQADAGVALVDRYWDRVHAFAFRLSVNKADAEDIAQETFLRAFAGLNEFPPDGQFKAWLLRIAANLFLDAKRAARSHDVTTGEMGDYPQRGATAEQTGEQRELLEAVDRVMLTLPKEQRTVVLLRALEHMEYSEIATALSLKESTVRWHMYEARRVLRQKLSKAFDLEAFGDE